MKRIFMLMSLALMLVAAMALSGVAQAKGSPSSKCKAEAASLGESLDGYNIIVGSDRKNDNFSSKATAGADVFCGFGGNDSIGTLDEGDIFIGGAGDDFVSSPGTFSSNKGTFYGGDGNDRINLENEPTGTFDGGAGDDYVYNNHGTFNGDSGNDSVNMNYGTFNGGDGVDTIEDNRNGTYTSVESCSSPYYDQC